MLLSKKAPSSSKCFFTHLLTEPRTEGAKPQPSKKPYSTIETLPWAHTVDLIVPEEIYALVIRKLDALNHDVLRYSRVFMSLLDVLSGDFFNTYIKTGNILMRSSGRCLIDNIYYIHSGVLHLELDRPTYERCGLVGEPIPDGGRKHAKQRFLVKVNLRLPSMLHGKKGFERVVWAAKEVLAGNQEWLFVDLANDQGQAEGPISKHHPFQYEVKPEVTIMRDMSVPSMPNGRKELPYTYAEELLEWVGLVGIDSPRVRAGDSIDPYLCRYQVPREYHAEDWDIEQSRSNATASIVRMRWRGFVPPVFIKNVLLCAEQVSIEQKNWIAVNACGFGRQSYTILGTAGTEWLCWQCEG